MKYWKITQDGYIHSVQRGGGGSLENELTEEEYEQILAVIRERPEPPEGCGYRLKDDLTWELYELPPAPEPEPDPEISDEEAMDIITGVTG